MAMNHWCIRTVVDPVTFWLMNHSGSPCILLAEAAAFRVSLPWSNGWSAAMFSQKIKVKETSTWKLRSNIWRQNCDELINLSAHVVGNIPGMLHNYTNVISCAAHLKIQISLWWARESVPLNEAHVVHSGTMRQPGSSTTTVVWQVQLKERHWHPY